MNAGAGLPPLQPPCCCTLRHSGMRGRCQTQHVSTQAPTERAAGVGPGARQLQTQTRGRQGSAARARAGGRMRRRAGRRSRRLRRACWRCRAQTASRRASWRRRSSRRASRWPPWSASAGSRALSRSCSLVRGRARARATCASPADGGRIMPARTSRSDSRWAGARRACSDVAVPAAPTRAAPPQQSATRMCPARLQGRGLLLGMGVSTGPLRAHAHARRTPTVAAAAYAG